MEHVAPQRPVCEVRLAGVIAFFALEALLRLGDVGA